MVRLVAYAFIALKKVAQQERTAIRSVQKKFVSKNLKLNSVLLWWRSEEGERRIGKMLFVFKCPYHSLLTRMLAHPTIVLFLYLFG